MREEKPLGCHGLPSRLRLIRVGVGLSGLQLRLAAKASNVASYENGTKMPRPDTAERMARALGVDPAYLAFGDSGTKGSELVTSLARLGGRLLVLRTLRGLLVADLARASGVSREIISGAERKSQQPDIETVERLALALNVSPGVLAFGAREEE